MNFKTTFISLLRKSEKYTKTDMVYLAKGGSWLTLNRIISSISSFLLVIIFANFLPKETYGNYKYVISTFSILAIPALAGMGTSVIQTVARGFEGSFKPALLLKFRWAFIGSLASLLMSGYYWFQGNVDLTLSFLITGIFLPFFETFNMYDALLYGKKLFGVSSVFNIITKVVTLLAIAGAIVFGKNVYLILLVYFFSYTALRFIFLRITLKRYPPNTKKDTASLTYGKHLSLINILNTTASYLDRILAFNFLGAVPLAVYSVAIAGPEQLKGLLGFFKNLLFPKFAEEDDERIKRGIKSKFIRLSLLGIVIIISYILLAPFLFKIFFPEYMEAVFLSQVFSLSLLNFGFFPAGTYLRAKKKIKEQYISNMAGAIFQIVSMIILVYWQGLLGLVIARILSRMFTSSISVFLYYKVTRESSNQ